MAGIASTVGSLSPKPPMNALRFDTKVFGSRSSTAKITVLIFRYGLLDQILLF